MALHHIRSLSFDIDFFSEEKAFHFQKKFQELLKEKLTLTIEKVFSEFLDETSLLRLDNLELDLGEVLFNNFETEIDDRLEKALKDALMKKMGEIKHFQTSDGKEEILSLAQRNIEIILFFLENGHLPWWGTSQQNSVDLKDIFKKAIQESPQELGNKISLLATKNPQVIVFRLATQFSEAILLQFVAVFPAIQQNVLQNWLEDVAIILAKTTSFSSSQDLRKMIWQEVLQLILVNKITAIEKEIFTTSFITKWAEKIDQQVEGFFYQLRLTLEEIKPTHNFKTKLVAATIVNTTQQFSVFVLKNNWQTSQNFENAQIIQSHEQLLAPYQESQIWEFVKQIAANHITFIQEFEQSLTQIFIKDKLIDVSPTHFKRKFLQAVLDYCFAQTSSFHGEVFSKKVLQYLIKAYKIDLQKLKDIPQAFTKLPTIQLLLADTKLTTSLENKQNENAKESTFSEPQLIQYFIMYGAFPWEYQLRQTKLVQNLTLEKIEKYILTLYETKKEIFQRFVAKIDSLTSAGVVERIKKQFSDSFAKLLIENLPKSAQAAKNKFLQTSLLEEVFNNPDLLIYHLNFFLKHEHLADDLKNLTYASTLIEKLSQNFPQEAKLFVADLVKKLATASLKKLYIQAPKTIAALFTQLLAYENLKENFEKLTSEIKTWEQMPTPEKQVLTPPNELPQQELPIKNALYLRNAGMVILHPFLQRFFTMLDFIENKQFKSVEIAHQAVYILQYLVNKDEEPLEFDLILNKLICGLPFQLPIHPPLPITDAQKELCESLLEGVIQNWPILKNSSTDNLRGSFLIREGKLEEKEKGYTLKVEQKGLDALMDQLPWSVGMVKFPWMKKTLYVEWR